jgi:hypothetical protein
MILQLWIYPQFGKFCQDIEHCYILKIIIIVFNINYIFIIIFKKVTHNLFVILNYNTIIFSFFIYTVIPC